MGVPLFFGVQLTFFLHERSMRRWRSFMFREALPPPVPHNKSKKDGPSVPENPSRRSEVPPLLHKSPMGYIFPHAPLSSFSIPPRPPLCERKSDSEFFLEGVLAQRWGYTLQNSDFDMRCVTSGGFGLALSGVRC